MTICGGCFDALTASLVAFGYVASRSSGTSLWGAVHERAIWAQSHASAVLVGMYLRGKGPTGLEANRDAMCSVMNGQRGNILRSMLFSGMQGDAYAQDVIWSSMSGGTTDIEAWQSETGMSFEDMVEHLLEDMSPETLGTWLSLVTLSSSTCLPCTESAVWEDLQFAAQPVAKFFTLEQTRTLRASVVRSLNVGCDTFERESADWATCSRWGFVVDSTIPTSEYRSIEKPQPQSQIQPRLTACQNSLLAFQSQVIYMNGVDDVCADDLLSAFTQLLDTVIWDCFQPDYVPFILPFLSFGQVMCHSQPLYTGGTGEDCFRVMVDKIAHMNILTFDAFPVCIPCTAEILTREKMDLAFDLFCATESKYPAFGTTWEYNCVEIINVTVNDPDTVPIPSECLIPITPSGVPTEEAPSQCEAIITAFSDKLSCCCRIYNDMYTMMGVQAGNTGLPCHACYNGVQRYTVGIAGMDYNKARETIGDAALLSMVTDEIAHRIPAVVREEFVRNVYLAPPPAGSKRDSYSESAIVELEYQPMSETLIYFDVFQENETLFEFDVFLTDEEMTDDTVYVVNVQVENVTSTSQESISLASSLTLLPVFIIVVASLFL
ncbi:hypothetical protein Pelo_2926 [Pelomyxa schiedti]|nr:hypothetical protein Pelo_2926 [Pelomyxa schiedti]